MNYTGHDTPASIGYQRAMAVACRWARQAMADHAAGLEWQSAADLAHSAMRDAQEHVQHWFLTAPRTTS